MTTRSELKLCARLPPARRSTALRRPIGFPATAATLGQPRRHATTPLSLGGPDCLGSPLALVEYGRFPALTSARLGDEALHRWPFVDAPLPPAGAVRAKLRQPSVHPVRCGRRDAVYHLLCASACTPTCAASAPSSPRCCPTQPLVVVPPRRQRRHLRQQRVPLPRLRHVRNAVGVHAHGNGHAPRAHRRVLRSGGGSRLQLGRLPALHDKLCGHFTAAAACPENEQQRAVLRITAATGRTAARLDTAAAASCARGTTLPAAAAGAAATRGATGGERDARR